MYDPYRRHSGVPESKVLSTDQLQVQGNHDEGPSIQFRIEAALEKQNTLLRQMVEKKEDEITELEHKLAQMEIGKHSTNHFPVSISRLQYEVTIKQPFVEYLYQC